MRGRLGTSLNALKVFVKQYWPDVACVCISALVILCLFEPVRVVGTSMLPTLNPGDGFFLNKVVYKIRAPGRGEIVVFRYPPNPKVELIKRVISIPGEEVAVCEYGTFAVRSGDYWRGSCLGEIIKTISLKTDEYFVVGDNVNWSNDSRSFGPVKEELIVGRAELFFWPPEKMLARPK